MIGKSMVELLDDYAYALERLDITLDHPGSDMTLGEYEDERMRITERFAESIAATMGGTDHYDTSDRRGTVAILHGGRVPEEVIHIGEDGATHYRPFIDNPATDERFMWR